MGGDTSLRKVVDMGMGPSAVMTKAGMLSAPATRPRANSSLLLRAEFARYVVMFARHVDMWWEWLAGLRGDGFGPRAYALSKG